MALKELNEHRKKLNTYFEDMLGHKIKLKNQIDTLDEDTQNQIKELNTQDEK